MKKKIVNALLMVALVAPSVGSLVSCKDYNEDLKTEVDGEIASLRKTLQDQINSLTDLVKSINSCKCDLSLYLSKKEAEEKLPKMAAMLDKLAAKGVIHKNQASKRKSGVQKLVNTIK